MRQLAHWMAAAAVALTLAACGGDDAPTGPLGDPYIVGRVTSVLLLGDAVTILVEERPGIADAGDKALARVDDVTVVRLPNDQPGTFRSITTGQWVRLWFEGAVAQSYPVQGLAARVVIDSVGTGLRP